MIRPSVVLGVARAEARSIRRLARYWIFAILAAIIGLVSFAYYGLIHGLASHFSGTIGITSPRYLFAALGLWPLVIFLIGFIFLAFDIRARDVRERMAEVLDVRPMTNLELVGGRFLGILLTGWIPVLLASLLLQLLGWIAETFNWPVGEMIEPRSLLAFLFLTSIPAFAFQLSLVFLLSLWIRNRFLSAVIMFVVVGGSIWAIYRLPLYLIEHSLPLGFDISELMPRIISLSGFLIRISLLVAAFGLLALAAAVHPRLDAGSRQARVAAGVGLLFLAIAGMGSVVARNRSGFVRFQEWKAAHEARRDDPAIEIAAIQGRVEIEPGRSLAAELEVRLRAPRGSSLKSALFTLNPGLKVDRIADASGQELRFDQGRGLLDVQLGSPLAPEASTTLRMEYSGAPHTRFGYLDSVRHPFTLPGWETQLLLLGLEPGIFHPRYVGLMPGIRWLPAAGADVGRDDPAHRPPHFFDLDLEVDLPGGWTAAGPGRRREVESPSPDRVRYRFAPPAPLPEVALLASRFESRSAEIEGVEFEVLVHPDHSHNLDVFAEAGAEIRQWIGERLRQAQEIGLDYPYGALTLVEIPVPLRGFGGGWRMDTVHAPPGLLLMRETSFPTSRFEFPFRDPERFKDREGGIARAKREVLERFFENDFSGGNLFVGAARNFFTYQTAARGEVGLPLDFVALDLTNRLLTDKQGFFSAHLFNPAIGTVVAQLFPNYFSQQGRVSVAEAMITTAADQPEVWDQALEVALGDIDPWQDPGGTVNLLALKGGALSRWILDGLGWEKTGELLAALRRNHTGTTYGRDDLLAAGHEVGVDLEELLGDWLGETALPGFVASGGRLFRLADDENGLPRYQFSVHLRNEEAAPGLVRLSYTTEEGGRNVRWDRSEPFRVPAGQSIEIGLVTSKAPRQVEVAPYISLNRKDFSVALPPVDEEKIVEQEPLEGSRPSDWKPPVHDWIVVDDLDAGFSVEGSEGPSGARLGGFGLQGAFGLQVPYDGGLPVQNLFGPPPPVWSRWVGSGCWGKYRHTLAVVRAGKGDAKAVFSSDLPTAGSWRLALHLPPQTDGPMRNLWRRGEFELAVVHSRGREEIQFDAAGGEIGWNTLGEFEVAAGEVRVELTNRTNGTVVLADAIRWQPWRTSAGAPDSDSAGSSGVGEPGGGE